MNKNLRFITRTALLLAVTLLFQMSRPIFQFPFLPVDISSFFVGSLVNAALLVATGTIGMLSGLIISLIAPVVAFMQGQVKFVWMIPLVAGGNVIIVILFGLFRKKNQWLALAGGAVLKFLFLWISIVKLALPLAGVQGKPAVAMSFSFGWPQLVTAVIGGLIAIPVIKALEKVLNKESVQKAL